MNKDARLQALPRRWNLVARRERWGLTWRGWLLVLVLGGAVAVVGLLGIHPFLALTAPVQSRVVVVEGWVPPVMLREVAQRYRAEEGSVLYCTGGPSDQAYDSLLVEDTCAAEAARTLLDYGIPAERLVVVPCWTARRDRTFASAVALRQWFEERGQAVSSLNVVTEGAHGRRSRLMFERAFGRGVEVGVVSIPDHEYEAARWWRYSEGIKAVISETAGYVYARVLFRADG